MARHSETHIITGNALVVWDGITKPETTKNGQPLSKPKYSLKLALQPNDPSVAEIDAIAKAALQNSKFKGVMPHGGSWPLSACNPQIADGVLNGMVVINPKTEDGSIAQKVWDANGQPLNPMTYSRMLYPGAVVQVMVHAFAFDNVQKGVALGLDGIRIVDAQAPQLNIGASLGATEVGAAFGAVPVQGAPAAPPTGYAAPGAPPAGYPAPGAPPAGYAAPGAPPAGYAAPGAPPAGYPAPGAPPAGYAAPGAPPTGPITPAHDFLTPGAPPAGYPTPVGVGAATPPMPPQAPAHQMTAAANGYTFEQMVAAGWTEAALRANGMML